MQQFLGPSRTPRVIKSMIWIIAICSLLYPILTYFLIKGFNLRSFGFFFPLSWMGLKQGFIWQFLTYFFVHSVGTNFSLWFLIMLFFHLFLFWFTGCELASRYGTLRFMLFYLGGGIFAGLWTMLYFILFDKQGILVGSSPPVYAMLMVWGMIYPKLLLHIFLVWRVHAKWIVLLLLGISLLLNLFSGDFAYFIADLAGILWGFCIGHFLWKLPNPYWGRFR